MVKADNHHDRISKKIALHRAMRVEYYASRVESMRVMWVEYSHRLGSLWVFESSTHMDTNSSNSLNSSNKYSLLLELFELLKFWE